MISLRFPGDGVTVQESDWMASGAMVADYSRSRIWVRHLSEFHLWLSGASWHPAGDRCPTWTDAAECRCMVDP